MSLPKPHPDSSQPIGVFDSGIGGLTVVAALRRALPSEKIYYIGDTARVPYGGKSPQTVERYSQEISQLLLDHGAKAVVVACNTASALGVPRLERTVHVPVVGVIIPGARAAVKATRNGRIGVIGTRATIQSRAYEHAIKALLPTAKIISHACPVLVPLIEEGWLHDTITNQAIERYLRPLLDAKIDTLVLGCTHYPLLREAIAAIAGPDIVIVDSAENCASHVGELLIANDLAAPTAQVGGLEVALTDHSTGFLPVAEKALGLHVGGVRVIGLPG